MRFATVRLGTDPRLHYAERGGKEGETIVFLHAYADSWFSYSRVLPLLSPAFVPDQRGHGNSDKPECCYAADDFAADVDAFMDAVAIEGATLVGDSSGGLIAQRVALSYPHRVSRLVLIGSPTTLVSNEAVMDAGEDMLALEDPIPPEFVSVFVEGLIHYPVPAEFFAGVVSEGLKVPARVWRDYYEGVMLTTDDRARLGEIGVPTLILWGEQDAVLPREEQERRGIDPRCHLEDVPRHGPPGALGAARVGRAGPGGLHQRHAPRLAFLADPHGDFGEPPQGEVREEGRAGKMERGRGECTGSRSAPVLWGRPATERTSENPVQAMFADCSFQAF